MLTFEKILLLVLSRLVCHSAKGLSCYKCNTTLEDPNCLGGNPSIMETCKESEFERSNGCFSMLINGADIYKGCLAYISAMNFLVSYRACVHSYTKFDLKNGICVKGRVSDYKYDGLMKCLLSGAPQYDSRAGRDSGDEVEVVVCICQGVDLCNAHTDKMDPGGSQVEIAEISKDKPYRNSNSAGRICPGFQVFLITLQILLLSAISIIIL